jgi:hypothetical protein
VKRRSIPLVILLVLIATGPVAIFWLFRSFTRPPNDAAIHAVLLETTRVYCPGVAGEYAGLDHQAAFSNIWTSDGLEFYRRSDYFNSATRAHAQLDKALKRATTIFRREPLFGKDGRNVGERVIATFPFDDADYGPASLLFADGSTFRYVQGSSLHSILAYERDLSLNATQQIVGRERRKRLS